MSQAFMILCIFILFFDKTAVLSSDSSIIMSTIAPKVTTIGDRVKIKHKSNQSIGVVKFIGIVKGRSGIHYGIELDTANKGDNNGVVQSIKYFTTSRRKGVFLKKSAILKTNSKNNTAPRVSVGNKVKVLKHDCEGTVQFIGEMDDRNGIWYGIALQHPKGTTNGKIKGREYFRAQYKHGMFVKEDGFEAIKSHFIIIAKKKAPTSPPPNTDKAKPLPIAPSSPPRQTQPVQQDQNDNMYKTLLDQAKGNAIKRRQDIQKVVNAMDGTAAYSQLNDVITSYDDRKEVEDIEWLKIIATLKTIHDKNRNSNDSDTTTQKDAFERRLKFEKGELKQQYESQIKTLILDRQRMEKQLAKHGASQADNNGYIAHVDEKESQSDDNKVDVEQLKRDKEQAVIVIRAKDEIIKTANEKIKELREEIRVLKEEEQKEELQMDRLSRDRAKELLQKRVSDQQQNSLAQLAQRDVTQKQTISEMLAECSKEDATDIIYSMGVIKFDYDKKLRRDTYNLDLTNNSVLRNLTDKQRRKWMEMLAYCICDDSGAQKIEKLKMTNMNIDDKLFPDFMDILIDNIEHFHTEEWWLESNKIGNVGIQKLSQFLASTPKTLEIVKMYNNKVPVATKVLNNLLTDIESNDTIQQFTFEWRLQQHRDRIAKQLRKNQDAKRKRRWANK
eukprot:986351_1